MIDFGSRAGTWTALALFGLLFAVLGWAVARAIRQRSGPARGTLGRAMGMALFAGPVALIYWTSLGGFYTAFVDGAALRLQSLAPFISTTLPLADILSVTAQPWPRGRWRLVVLTNDETRYESATSSRDVVDRAAAELGAQVRAAQPQQAQRSAGADPLEITYIAGEGVLIDSGGRRILIDSLHREYEPEYPFLPPAEQERIETAEPPYADIRLILVSHFHRDHFHPDAVARHMRHSPRSRLLSSPQVVDETRKSSHAVEGVAARLEAVWPDWGGTDVRDIGDIRVELLGLRHGTGRQATIQNLGHLITLGGRLLLHVGDAMPTAANFEPLNLPARQIDVAFLPSWYLAEAEGRATVRRFIRPRHIIAVHMGARDADEYGRRITQAFPQAVVFSTLLQKVRY